MPWILPTCKTNRHFLTARMTKINRTQAITLANGYRLQWEPAQETHVLLYPEGMVKLNQTAALILSKIDNKRNLEQITEELNKQFPDANIDDDVELFIKTAVEKRWLILEK